VRLNKMRDSMYPHFAHWLLVLACTGGWIGAASANERSAERLNLGQELRGEITSADRLNYNDGSRSKLYRFTAKPGEVLSFQTSGALKARLTLHVDGEQVAQSQSHEDNIEDNTALSYRVNSTQPHILAVSGQDHRLNSEVLDLYAGGTLTPDVTIHDWLGTDPRELALQIDRAGLYQIDMVSDEFDTKLELTGNGQSLSNDDGGEGTNSRLVTELSPGRYTLRATGYASTARGLYRLTAAAYALPEGVQLQNSGALVVNSPELTGMFSGQARVYELQLEQRQLVTIDMRSDMFDAYLELSGPNVSREDDDSGERLNARIRAILEPGRYQITARAAGSRSNAGVFQLAASGREVPENSGGPLTIGQSSNSELLPGLPNQHPFTVRQAGRYVIEMTSDAVDSYLRLYRNGDAIDEDDDSGQALNARIERHLSPGDYMIEASAVDDGSGSYQIEVRQR